MPAIYEKYFKVADFFPFKCSEKAKSIAGEARYEGMLEVTRLRGKIMGKSSLLQLRSKAMCDCVCEFVYMCVFV